MALSTFVGSLAQPGSTGNQAITGLGFQPKAIIFYYTSLTAVGNGADNRTGYGFATSSSDRRCVYGSVTNGASSTAGGHDNTKCITFINDTPTVLSAADFVSMDADGFTINWTTVDATARTVCFLALGGSDLTNVKTGQGTSPASTGNAATTGIGFKPDTILTIFVRGTATAPPSNSTTGNRHQIGFGVSSSQRNVLTTQANYNGPFVAKRLQLSTKVISMMDNAGAAKTMEADLVSFDSDGFTLNWSTVSSGVYFHYLVLKGAKFATGVFNQPTSTGNNAVTGVGFQPQAIMLASANNVSSASIVANKRISIGAASSSSARAHIWMGATDTGSTTICNQDYDNTKVIKMMTEGTVAIQAAADLNSFDSDGFTLNWTTADATAREVIYFAVGAASAATAQYYPFLISLGVGM